jgi:pimeloyl-ACP methyl ester carboxylesterase
MTNLAILLITFAMVAAFGADAKVQIPAYTARLAEFKYPYEVKHFKLPSQKQNLEMSYMDLKPKIKTSKVVVLLHGKNFAGYYWQRIAADLFKRGYRVIIPDQIGFGKSSKPAAYQYSFPQLALNTQTLLTSVGVEKYHLVGHSMGGMLAITMANLYEQKVEKLTLINPIGLETYLNYVEPKDTDFFYQNELNKTREKAIAYQRKNYYDGQWKPEYEALLQPEIGLLKGPEWKQVAWSNALTYGPIFSEDMIPRIRRLTIPTNLLLGVRDKTGPGRGWKKKHVDHQLGQYDKFGKQFKALLPSSNVIELSGLGHMPQFEDYQRFSKKFYTLFD